MASPKNRGEVVLVKAGLGPEYLSRCMGSVGVRRTFLIPGLRHRSGKAYDTQLQAFLVYRRASG